MTTEAGKDQMLSSDLGGLVSEFRGHIPVVPWLLVAALAGLLAGHVVPVAGVVTGVTVAGAGVLLAWYRARQLSVEVHSEGLMYQARGKTEIWEWKDVEEFVVLIEKREFRSVPHSPLDALFSMVLEALVKASLPKAVKYRIAYELRRPGHKLVLTSSIQDYKRLGEIAGNCVADSRLVSLLASFRAGQTLAFGALLLGPDGLTHARPGHPRQLPLDSLAGVSVSTYVVAVNQVGTKAPWASASIAAVPNAALLAALAGRVAAGTKP